MEKRTKKGICAVVPIRKGSQRVRDKNFRSFGDGNLYTNKIKQLITCDLIDEIFISTTDTRVYETIEHEKLKIIKRPEKLGSNETKTEDLIKYVLENVDREWMLWTHVTSPFFDGEMYRKFIENAISKIKYDEYDSALTVTEHRGYFIQGKETLYDKKEEKWPATQKIEPILEINNAAFFGRTKTLREMGDRIGDKPYYFICNGISSIDIDWEEDFKLAEIIYKSGL